MTGRLRIACVLLCLLPGMAWAADSKTEPPDLARFLRWDPLRVRPGFQVSNVGFDNNIFADPANRVGDYTATLSPKIDGLVLFGSRAFLTFDARLDYTTYLEFRDQNFLNQRYAARATLPVNRLALFVDGQINRINERPIDRDDIRPLRKENGLAFGAVFEPGWRSEVEVGTEFMEIRYDDLDFDSNTRLLDRDTSGIYMDARYDLLGRTRLILDFRTAELDFLQRLPTGENQDSIAWDVLPGLEFGQGGNLIGTAQIGWGKINAREPTRPDFADVIGKLNLAYKVNARTTLTFKGTRIPGFAVTGNSTYYLETGGGVRGLYYFNRILGLDSGVWTARLTFPDSTGFQRADRLVKYDVGLRFRLAENSIGRRVEYSLRLISYRRRSNIPALDNSRTTLGVGAVVGF